MSVNKVILVGRVGKDPEITNFNNGGSISKFPFATTETYKNRNGEKVKNTEWHNIEASGKIVEIIQKYIVKGDQLYIEGRIKTRSWDDKNGNKRYTTVIRLDNMTMLGSKKESQQQQPQQQQQSQEDYDSHDYGNTDDVDDLPF